MIFPEVFQIIAGSAVIVLATVWLHDKRTALPARKVVLWAWNLAWFGTAGFSYFCMIRAQDVLGYVESPGDRMAAFAVWYGRAGTWRILSAVVLVVGLMGLLVAWRLGDQAAASPPESESAP